MRIAARFSSAVILIRSLGGVNAVFLREPQNSPYLSPQRIRIIIFTTTTYKLGSSMSNQKPSQPKPQPTPSKPQQPAYKKPVPVFIGDSVDIPKKK